MSRRRRVHAELDGSHACETIGVDLSLGPWDQVDCKFCLWMIEAAIAYREAAARYEASRCPCCGRPDPDLHWPEALIEAMDLAATDGFGDRRSFRDDEAQR